MATVDPLYAQWLQAPADYAVRADATAAARWGATAVTSERLTGIARKADAEIEGDRQLAFFARGPFAVEVHQLTGAGWAREIGRIVNLSIDQLGYDAGLDVFVIEVEADRATGLAAVTVLRPLRTIS